MGGIPVGGYQGMPMMQPVYGGGAGVQPVAGGAFGGYGMDQGASMGGYGGKPHRQGGYHGNYYGQGGSQHHKSVGQSSGGNVQKYKTSLCRHFEAQGTCSLAESCVFAHGKQELRSMNDVSLTLVPLLISFSLYPLTLK